MRYCRIHGGPLLEVDSRGLRYRKPVCLECLPPHRPACIQLEYVNKQSLWLFWQMADDELFDLKEWEFWERFGDVPECRCPERRRGMELRQERGRPEPTPVVFRLNQGGTVTAWTWRTLRPRLAKLLSLRTGNKAALHWELEQLASALDTQPAESPRTRARAILEELRAFYEGGRS